MSKTSVKSKPHFSAPTKLVRAPIQAIVPAAPADIDQISEAVIKHDFVTTTVQGAEQWLDFMVRRAREHGIFMVKETMTAAMARALLDSNPDNRSISSMKVLELANDMRQGTFDSMNGQTIQISEEGFLNDGQHRCHAKLESLVDLPFHFMFGLKRTARLTIDQGRARTAGDYLTMSGHEGGKRAAAIGALLYMWRSRGNVRDIGGKSKDRLSSSQRAQYSRDHTDQIMASIRAVPVRPGMTQLGGYGLLAFCHLIFAEKHFAGATDFIDKIVTGRDLAENSPINNCRRRLMTEKRLHRHERLELIIRAWNAYRRGDTPKNLIINSTMPEIAD